MEVKCTSKAPKPSFKPVTLTVTFNTPEELVAARAMHGGTRAGVAAASSLRGDADPSLADKYNEKVYRSLLGALQEQGLEH